ncbi:hypothetical protein M2103_001300 [Ereboglobus sp. PH5-5]|nr:hypothetical protein [Ereboglobus sp. PH5-5]
MTLIITGNPVGASLAAFILMHFIKKILQI